MSDAPSSPAPVYQATGLRHEYRTAGGPIPVLSGVDLTVQAGEIVAITGPSGSGKSTLLFILGLLLSPDAGTCRAEGQDLLTASDRERARFRRRYLGFVFQSANLLEFSSVYDNLEFPLIYAGVPPQERPERIRTALQKVDLVSRMHQPTNRLSGGEQQRAAIARALINQPRLILADEPTGQVDTALRDQLLDHFVRIAAADGTAMVIVTHDPGVAARCHRIYQLAGGHLARVGPGESA
jgi:putative ABC transport system ATP-binding protein